MEYQKGLRTFAGGVRRPVTWDFSALGGTRTPNLLIRSAVGLRRSVAVRPQSVPAWTRHGGDGAASYPRSLNVMATQRI